MEPRDFCYWLQGYFEIQGLKSNPKDIPKEHAHIIQNHLDLVFHHSLDKQYKEGDGSQEVHDGKPPSVKEPNKGGKLLMRC